MNTLSLRSVGARVATLGLLASLFSPAAALAASSAISIGTVSPTNATVGSPATLVANVSSSAGSITSCNLYIDNDDKGAMTLAGGTATRAYTFTSAQVYTAFVFCRDSAGNFNSGANIGVWAQGGGGSGGNGDITPPVVSSVSPASAEKNKAVTLSVNVTDNGGVASCELMVDDFSGGLMMIANGVASKSPTLTVAKTYSVFVTCRDIAGNIGVGTKTNVVVSEGTGTQPAETSLVKLACPAGAKSDNPCKAVYYVGKDGKRHAFPNEKVFMTWYANFNGVKDISAAEMSALTLGKNVTYRPGSKMVKFITVPYVYAVSKGGVLRWVKTEADAAALYGADWNKKIDDISDAFFTSYSYGTDVSASEPFNIQTELNEAATIDATL